MRKLRVSVNAGWTMVEAKVLIPLCSLTSANANAGSSYVRKGADLAHATVAIMGLPRSERATQLRMRAGAPPLHNSKLSAHRGSPSPKRAVACAPHTQSGHISSAPLVHLRGNGVEAANTRHESWLGNFLTAEQWYHHYVVFCL